MSNHLAKQEAKRLKGKALSKVTMAFTLWACMLTFVINSMQMGLILTVLQAAGVDVSALQQGR